MQRVQSKPHENIEMRPLPAAASGSGSNQGQAFDNLMQSGGGSASRPSSPQQNSNQAATLPTQPASYSEGVGSSSHGAYQTFPFAPPVRPETASSTESHSQPASPASHGADLYGASAPPSLHQFGASAAPSVHQPDANSLAGSNAHPGLQHPDNAGTITVPGNAGEHHVGVNSGRLFSTNNSGIHDVQSNTGLHHSVSNTGNEFIRTNTGQVSITHSSGNHVIDSNNGGHVQVSNLQPGAHVQINHPNGTTHQDFPPGSMMNRRYPNGVDHKPATSPLSLDQYGSYQLSNVTGGIMRHPMRYGSGTVGAALTGTVLVNNAFATGASLSGSVAAGKHFGGP